MRKSIKIFREGKNANAIIYDGGNKSSWDSLSNKEKNELLGATSNILSILSSTQETPILTRPAFRAIAKVLKEKYDRLDIVTFAMDYEKETGASIPDEWIDEAWEKE